MRIRLLYIAVVIAALSLLTGCSSTKYVPDNQYLLDKVVITSDDKDFKEADLRDYLHQRPNFKAFGLIKWQLYLYNWSGKNDKSWVNKQLRRMGEAPVVLDTMLVEQSADELERFLVNKGYIHADVTTRIDTLRHKKAVVTYMLHPNTPYRIRNYQTAISDPVIDSIAHIPPKKRNWLSNMFKPSNEDYVSLVKEGNPFDRDLLDLERSRVTKLVHREGYYAFNKDHLAYMADSAFNQNAVDLEMYLKPYRRLKEDGSVKEEAHRPYYINKVTVVADYDPLKSELENSMSLRDTMKAGDIYVVYANRRFIRPSALARSVYLAPGKQYDESNVEQTYSSFARLRALKNINIRFREFEENDSLKLDCSILAAPTKLQGFGVELEGTHSAGDLGFASSVNYQHRNLFRRSETFSFKVRGAYEALGSSKSSIDGNYWEFGAETGLMFPRFVFPFVSESFKRRMKATTEFKIGYSFQTRPEYQRTILSGGWSYIWQDRLNTQSRHVFKLVDIDYVHLPKIDKAFADSLPESTRQYNFTDQFVLGIGYTYTFNNYVPQNKNRNTHSLRVSVEMAGNLLYGFSKVLGAHKNDKGFYSLFGIPYAQFTKVDVDFSKNIALDAKNRVAYRIGVGVGYPYGNMTKLPFERSYFSGGANSVRGWSVRSLGPGSMGLEYARSFADQVGDIRLDMNLEYRTKLFWKFEMAAYVDAGNIWTFHEDASHPKANFDFSRFYKEIAFSYGLGLRADFNFFVLRFDTGMKAYDPQQRGGKKWAIKNPNFNSRTGNFAWHFAVGYPF
jgi:outer membrane protein assembly factor BamA